MMRWPGSFKRIEKGMDISRERDVSMAVCRVITSDSIKDLDGLYDFIIDKGVKVWQIQIAFPLGRLKPNDPLLIKPEQIKEVYDVFYEKRKLNHNIHIDFADDVGYYPPWVEGYIRQHSLKELCQDPNNFRYNRQFSMSQLSGYYAEYKYGPLCKAGCSSAAISHTNNIGKNPMCIYRIMMEKER